MGLYLKYIALYDSGIKACPKLRPADTVVVALYLHLKAKNGMAALGLFSIQ